MLDELSPTHPYLDSIKPYVAPDLEALATRAGLQVEQLIRLSLNENPYGPTPEVVQAVAGFASYQFYPDYRPLREAVAQYAGVTPERVVLGSGADELIDLLVRLFVEPGQAVVMCPPTFDTYRFCAEVNRCRVLSIPRRQDFSLDVAAIETAVQQSEGSARLLLLASPHNPSGQAIPLGVIQRLLGLPLVIAIDEAYIEFGGETAVPLLPEHRNLAVIRTFSKWAGLAGLRLGYAVLGPDVARYLERMRLPYDVNAAAVVAGLATLANLGAVRARVAELIAERERLGEALAALTWLEPLPSQANFILCRLKGRTAKEVVDGLARRGILIRRLSDPAVAQYVRIGVGRPDQNKALLAALRELE